MTTRQVGSLFVALQVHDRATASLGAFDSRLESSERKSKNLSQSVTDLGVGLTKLSAPATAFFGFATKAAIDFESAFAGVIKTVDASDAQLGALRDTIRDMATDPSNPLAGLSNAHQTIAQIMELGGQLGVPVGELESFAQVIGELGIATNLTTEEAAVMTAQFANITGMDFSNFDRFGATIVELGNNLATNERDIAIFAQRLAGIGSTVGLTEDQILALGGAMASVGLNAEAGGTAMTQTFNAMISAVAGGGSELESFARVAGTSASDFAAVWEADPQAALQGFLEGLGALDQAAQVQALDDLGLDGIRVADTLRRLSANTDLVANSFDLAAGAWKENNALSEEAQKRLETTAAQFNVFKNTIMDLAISIGDILLPIFNSMLKFFQGLILGVREVVDAFPGGIRVLAKFAGILSAAGVGLLAFGQALAIIPILFNPVTLAVGAVTAGIVALSEIWSSNFLGIKSTLMPILHALENSFRRIRRFISGLAEAFSAGGLTSAIDFFKDNIGAVGESLDRIWSNVDFHEIASNFLSGVGDALARATGAATAISTAVVDLIKGIDWATVLTNAQGAADAIVDGLKTGVVLALGRASGAAASISAGFLGLLAGIDWQTVFSNAGGAADAIVDALKVAVVLALGRASGAAASISAGFLGLLAGIDWQTVFSNAGGAADAIVDALKVAVVLALGRASAAAASIAAGFLAMLASIDWVTIFSNAGGAADAIVDALKVAVIAALNRAAGAAEAISGAVGDIFESVNWSEALSDAGSAIVNAWVDLMTASPAGTLAGITVALYALGLATMVASGAASIATGTMAAFSAVLLGGPQALAAAASAAGSWVASLAARAAGSGIAAAVVRPLMAGLSTAIWLVQGAASAAATVIGFAAGGLGAILGLLLSPIGAVILGVVAGVAAFVFFKEEIGKVIDWLENTVIGIIEGVAGAIEGVAEAIGLVKSETGEFGRYENPQGGAAFQARLDERRQHGGPVLGGQPYIVGEVGPELFVPGGNGQIVPNHALGGGGGFNFYGNLTVHANSEAEGRVAGRAAWDELEELWRRRG